MKDCLETGNGHCMNCGVSGCMNCGQQTAVFSISFTDGVSPPEGIGSANTMPEALELAADYMYNFRKDLTAACCEVPEGAQCFIDMRVCSTTGTTTQVVHMIG